MTQTHSGDPCRCEECGGFDDGPCKYDADPIAAHYYQTYVLYVENGNVPLTELPVEYQWIAREVRHHRNLRRRRAQNEMHEETRQNEMLQRAGVA